MAKFDLNSLKKSIQKSADSLKRTVAEATEKLPDSVKNANVGDSLKDLAKKGQDAFETLKTKSEESIAARKEKQTMTREQISSALQQKDQGELIISMPDALRIIYCMMAVDGHISSEEEQKFLEIGQELDPAFESYKDELIAECMQAVSRPAADDEEYYDNIHDYAGDVLRGTQVTQDVGIRGKVLMWDLLTVAYSDDDYSTNEKRLLKYLVKDLGIDSVVLLEMEHTVRTLFAIEQEESWLKNTDRTYAVVEERVNALSNRKAVIMNGVRELLAD